MKDDILTKIPNAIKSRVPRGSLLTLKGKPDLIGVEIGVQYGVNARWMLDTLDINLLYLVDPYKPYPSVSGNGLSDTNSASIKLVSLNYLSEFDNIKWIYKSSSDAVTSIPDDLDFVYIDGDHREVVLISDLKNYIPKVKIGGLIAGHDYDQPQVRNLVKKLFKDELKTGKHNDWWVIKREEYNEDNWIDSSLG